MAFLPFRNDSLNKDNENIAAGVIEDIIANLWKIQGLRIIPQTSTQRYRGRTDLKLGEIARELGADWVVEGSIQSSDDRVVVVAHLVEAEPEQVIWTQRYEKKMTDRFGLQGEIAVAIAEGMRANLGTAERRELNRPLSADPEAQKAYYLALGLMRNWSDANQLAEAEKALRGAIAADPSFAQAYAKLAILLSMNYDWGDDRTPQRQAQAAHAAQAALRLQPDEREAQMAMGIYYYRVLRNFDAAQAYLERALKGMPGNIDALFELAAMERRQGKWDDAMEKMARVAEIAPDDEYKQFTLARTYMFVRRYEDSWRVLERALQRMPESDVLRRS